VQKCDPFSLCSDAWLLVDQLNARRPAALQHGVKVVDREANVMDTGPALGDEARDGRVGVVRLKQLYQRLPGAEAHDARTVGVIQRDLGQSQHIPKKRKALGEGLDRNSNVGHASATRG